MRTVNPDVATLWVLRLGGRRAAFRGCLLLVLCGGLFLDLLLLEPRLGVGEEEGAFVGVLFTVLTYRWISVRQDVASMEVIPKSAGPVSKVGKRGVMGE